MQDERKPRDHDSFARRRSTLILGGGLLLILVLAAVFRGQVLEPFLVVALERALGLEVTFERVGGTVVAGLDLGGVTARSAEASPLASFAADRVAVRYSLPALLRGREAFLSTLRVSVAGADLDLDLTAPRPAAQPGGVTRDKAPQEAESPARPPGFPQLPRLAVRDCRLLVHGSGYEVLAEGLQGEVGGADLEPAQKVEIRAERLSVRHPALREVAVAVALNALITPGSLTISSAQVNGETLVENARLEFGERPGAFDLQLALRLWQGAAQLAVQRRGEEQILRWDIRGVDLRPDLVLSNQALAALRGRLTASGSATLGAGGLPTLAGTLALDWEGALIAGRSVDRLTVAATAEPGAVHVAGAGGRIGPNEIRFKDVALPASPLFAGHWRPLLTEAAGAFSASLGDVPAFLALWGVRAGTPGAAVPEHRLRLTGTLAKGEIRLTEGDLASGLGKAIFSALTLRFPGSEQGWEETGFSGGLSLDIPRLQELSALFPLPPLAGALRGSVEGRGTFARPEGRATLRGRGVAFDGRTVGDVDVAARAAAGRIEVDKLQVRQGGNLLTVRGASFSPGALSSSDRGALIDSIAGSFELRCGDIPALALLAGVPGERFANLPRQHLLTAAGTVGGRSIALAAATFATAGATVTLGETRVSLPSAWAAWKREIAVEGEAVVSVPDLGPLAALFGSARLQGSVKGRVSFSGTPDDPSARLEASAAMLAVDGHRVGDVTARGSARQRRVTLETVEISRGADRLRGRGAYDLGKNAVQDAEVEVTITDVAPWIAEFAPARFKGAAEKVPLSGRVRVRLIAAGPVPGNPLSVEAEISDATIQKVRAVRSAARAEISIDGPLWRPSLTAATLSAEVDGEAGDRSGHVSLDAGYEPGRLRIRKLEATGSGGFALLAEGMLPVDLAARGLLGPGPLALRVRTRMPHLDDVSVLLPPAYRLAGSLVADASVEGSWKEPQLRVELSGEGLDPTSAHPFVPPGPFTLRGAVTWNTAEARAEQVRAESPALACTLSGTWTSPPALASLVAGKGDAATGSLALRAAFSSPDIGWLHRSVQGLRKLRGRLAGEVTVEGPVGRPAFSGTVELDEAEIRYRNLPPVDAVSARVSVAGRTLVLERLGGNIGGSPFTLAGSVNLTDPADPVIDLRLQGKNALLYRAEGLWLRADSDLTLRGPVSALSLAGEVALTDSLFQRTFSVVDLLPHGKGKEQTPEQHASAGFAGVSFPDPPLRDMRLDLRLTGRTPFRIMTTVVRGAAIPDLRLAGTGLLPLLRGSVVFEGLGVALPSGIMEFEGGTLQFGEGGATVNTLDLVGRMRALGYEITAQIGGSLEAPEIVLSSLPPLPSEELLLLVLTGAPPGSATAEGGYFSAMATPMAVYLGKGLLERLLGGGGSWGGGAALQNRLDVRVGREMTRGGSVTVEAELLLKENLFRKGSFFYLTTDKDVYDQDNMGLKILFKFR